MKKKLLLGLLGLSAILGLSSCKAKEFTVTVNANNGSTEDSFVVKEDSTITAPVNPTKEGYTFAGWYLDANFTTAVDFANFKVTEDITLYAKWTVNTYTVTFNSNGGSDVASATVNHNNAVTLPTAPTKEGHTFVGWYTDEACTAQYTNGKITGNTTLYAKWTKDAVVFVVTFNTNGGSDVAAINVIEGEVATLPTTNPTKEGHTFDGWYVDEACTTKYTNQPITAATTLYAKWVEVVETVYTVTFNTNGGSDVAAQEVKEDEWGSFTVQKPADPTKPYAEFAGWFADEACTTPFDFSAEISSDITIYAKWDAEYEMVTTVADFDSGAAAFPGKAKPTEAVTIGRFTFSAGVYFEAATSSKTACVNNQQKDITFDLNGRTNSINFNIKYGSSGSTGTLTLYKLVDGEKVQVKSWDEAGQNDYSIEDLEAGTYVFGSVGSYRFYSLSITEELEKSAPAGLEIASLPQTAFLEGRDFNASGLSVYLTYENGRKDVLAETAYTVDSSAYVAGTPGTYTITISKDSYTTSYDVVVYDVQSVMIADHVLDSKRVTKPLEKVFIKDSKFSTANLAVNVTAVNVNNAEDIITFVLDSSEFTVSEPTMSSLGSQTITVTAFELTDTYEIIIVNDVLTDAEKVTVNVDAAAEVTVTSDNVTFKSVNDALRYLALCDLSEDTIKEVKVAAGSYYEKVEVNIPNVHLIGSNNESAETIIWYDRINGMTDPSGTSSYSTDGSASVSIRSTAVGFYAQDITFKNYYNTHELYLESLKISSDSQAVAVLVQADQSYFKNVKFTSYHDTLYAQIGRQFYENCYIEGRTDYIFGYNATAYFEGCIIHTIGAGLDQTNGGYVVATKGLSSGKGTDDIKYGYVFNECVFEADENTQAGSVSIARGWAECMAVMVMNSEISGAFSKEVYGNSESKSNDRYTKMNAGPVASLLLEYNNTGEGALIVPEDNAETTDVNEAEAFVAQYAEATCTIVTDASVAAPYADLLTVFAAENGNVKWNAPWAGNLEKNANIEIKSLDGKVLATYKSYVGSKLTSSQLSEIKKLIQVPENHSFGMFTSDSNGKNEYEAIALEENNTIYVVFEMDGEFQTNTYQFSLEELIASYGAEPADKTNIDTANLTGANSFLSLVNAASNKCVVRPGNKCMEIKDAQLAVTFKGTGTLSVAFASTGGSNTSHFAVLGPDGNPLVAASTEAQLVEGETAIYQVTGTKYVTVNYTITEAGTYQISCPSTPGRGGRVNNIVMTEYVPVAAPTQTDNYAFSLEELIASYGAEPADKTFIDTANLTGANSFLSLINAASNKCVVRPGNNCMEIKDAQLAVTFKGTGTLTVSFASTGGSNTSHFAVLGPDGNPLVAASTEAQLVEGETAIYQVTGTTYVTVNYTITEAGTYQISCPSTPGRGGRVNSIIMADTYNIKVEKPAHYTDTITYSFVSSTTPSDTVLVYGPETPFKDITITGTPRDNGNSHQMTNCTLTFKVKGGSSVTITGYPGYTGYIINGRTVDQTTYTAYFDKETEVTIVDNGGKYLDNIVINPDAVGHEAEIEKISVVGNPIDALLVGEALDLSNLKVKVHYNDGSFVLTNEGITTDAETTVNKDAAGTYTVTVSFGDFDASFNVTYKEASSFDDGFIREDKSWSFRTDTTNGNEVTTTYQGNTGTEAGLFIDATTGKLAPRGQQWAQFNEGTKITLVVAAGLTITINAYENKYTVNGVEAADKNTTVTAETTMVVEIVATGNTYIDSIVIA